MRYFPFVLARAQSDELAANLRSALQKRGWGLWAVEVLGGASFIGFIGLNPVSFTAHFTPAIEIGWRLSRPHWGHGFATEGARAALDYAFGELSCEQIVSFTATVNERSIRVMQRLGMTRDPAEDFDHPAVVSGELRRHVLYRVSRTQWLERPD